MPFEEIYCKNFCEFKIKLKKLKKKSNGKWIFRGETDSSRTLTTTLDRLASSHAGYTSIIEYLMINKVSKYEKIPLGSTELENLDNLIRWLSEMQHYGGVTRLSDWSYSRFIAKYFSLRKIKKDKDIVIYLTDKNQFLNLEEMISDPEFGRRELDEETTSEGAKFFTSLEVGIYFHEPKIKSNKRLKKQKGVFLIKGNIPDWDFEWNLDNCRFNKEKVIIYRFVIRMSNFEKLFHKFLLMISGYNEFFLFPGHEYANKEKIIEEIKSVLDKTFPR